MKKQKYNILLPALTLVLFLLNFSKTFAIVAEINVVGGGYRLRGPDTISFPTVTTSLSDQSSELNIRDFLANGQSQAQDVYDVNNANAYNYLAVTDLNGGYQFQVTVTANCFSKNGAQCPQDQNSTDNNFIMPSNFSIKNNDGNPATADIAIDNNSTSLSGAGLDSSTTNYADLSTQRILMVGNGSSPGSWRFFPMFKLTIPKGTNPGTYNSTLTFTII